MAIQVAFLRAINVGRRRVSMDKLRAPFEDLGLEDVSTFIASGNVVFSWSSKAAELESDIEAALRNALGFEVVTFIRPLARVIRIAADDILDDMELAHVGFLKTSPAAGVRSKAERLSTEVDTIALQGREIFWLPRAGMGRSSISGAALEKALGQPTTMRSVKMLRRLVAKLS